MSQSLPRAIAGELDAATKDWTNHNKTTQLWNRDKSLWTGADEDHWLGWLNIAEHQLAQRQVFAEVAEQAKSGGYRNAVVLGMGGSSLCPEVLAITFGKQSGFPALHIL